jgi:hypothetical protein
MFIFDHFDFVYYFQGLKATFKSGNVQKIAENIVIVLIDNNTLAMMFGGLCNYFSIYNES